MRIPRHKRNGARSAPGGLRAAGRALCIFAGCLLLAVPPRALSQSDDTSEYRVKLAFLYNFAQFVQWPADAFDGPSGPLTICVLGEDPFLGETGRSLRGRIADGHPVQIKKLAPGDDPRACHIIFVRGNVRSSEKAAARKILASLKGSSTLAVGEAKGFVDWGGLINLTRHDDKLRFEINLDAAMQTRLKISSKLLALAQIVKAEPTAAF